MSPLPKGITIHISVAITPNTALHRTLILSRTFTFILPTWPLTRPSFADQIGNEQLKNEFLDALGGVRENKERREIIDFQLDGPNT